MLSNCSLDHAGESQRHPSDQSPYLGSATLFLDEYGPGTKQFDKKIWKYSVIIYIWGKRKRPSSMGMSLTFTECFLRGRRNTDFAQFVLPRGPYIDSGVNTTDLDSEMFHYVILPFCMLLQYIVYHSL